MKFPSHFLRGTELLLVVVVLVVASIDKSSSTTTTGTFKAKKGSYGSVVYYGTYHIQNSFTLKIIIIVNE